MQLNHFPNKDQFSEMASDYNVIPVCVEILADTETPVSLLKKIYKNKGPVFLFESVEGGEQWGRYSFMSASARSHIRVYQDFVEIENNKSSQRIFHQNDPLKVLRDFMKKFKPASLTGLPRFWGGQVGYLTYEMISFFEAIPNRLAPDKPLAHFIIPDEILIFDNVRNTLLCVVISFMDGKEDADKKYKIASMRIETILAKIKDDLKIHPKTGNLVAGQNNRLTAVLKGENFRLKVKKVKQHIRQGDIIQAVISQSFSCEAPLDLWSLYRAQRLINPSPYLFFLHLDSLALVGSSPETMVRLEKGIATLRPIAGTRPRAENEQRDRENADELLKDEKERAEHLMLVDLGRNDLGRVAKTGTVQVTDLMVVERYSHVMHLVSNICCDLKSGLDAWNLLSSTFPAGTLSGAPKVRAMEIIDELEQEPREAYGGAVGYISFDGNMDMAITIRTACIENGRLTVRAGAGIVADSDPEKERIETVHKAMALQKALELMDDSI
ncbi:MAG: chorismate-binding protein [Deltaproteobacteria bacterium]|nr:chorismate-binding protein [Deltaproteobacteria bacterium]